MRLPEEPFAFTPRGGPAASIRGGTHIRTACVRFAAGQRRACCYTAGLRGGLNALPSARWLCLCRGGFAAARRLGADDYSRHLAVKGGSSRLLCYASFLLFTPSGRGKQACSSGYRRRGSEMRARKPHISGGASAGCIAVYLRSWKITLDKENSTRCSPIWAPYAGRKELLCLVSAPLLFSRLR